MVTSPDDYTLFEQLLIAAVTVIASQFVAAIAMMIVGDMLTTVDRPPEEIDDWVYRRWSDAERNNR